MKHLIAHRGDDQYLLTDADPARVARSADAIGYIYEPDPPPGLLRGPIPLHSTLAGGYWEEYEGNPDAIIAAAAHARPLGTR